MCEAGMIYLGALLLASAILAIGLLIHNRPGCSALTNQNQYRAKPSNKPTQCHSHQPRIEYQPP